MLAIQYLGKKATPLMLKEIHQRLDGNFQSGVHTQRIFSTHTASDQNPLLEKQSLPSFTTPSTAKLNKKLALEHFSHEFDQLKKCEAFAHPLFKTMTRLAKEGSLTKEQFSTFREFMLARIYLTMPSIAKLAEYALRNGDYKMFATALQNLKEEGGDGDISRMHPLLAEQAFNEIGQHFGLPKVTMKNAFNKLSAESSAMKNYGEVIERIYSENPAFASLAQEAASGGDGTTGMMADLYEFCDALRAQINPTQYEKCVLPYFAEHLHLESDGNYHEHAEDGVECQHFKRALGDAERYINNIEDANRGLTTMKSFVGAQENLFDAAQTAVLNGSQKFSATIYSFE